MLRLHWFLPTSGDAPSLVGAGQGVPGDAPETRVDGFRAPTLDYLARVAHAAEEAGFEAVLTPTGTFCEDAWLTTAALLRETERLGFLVAFRPGVINPVLAAQMAATYQRHSGGRLRINIVTGGEPREQGRFGDDDDKAERYARTAEFLRVLRGTWGEAPYDHDGRFFHTRGAMVSGAVEAPEIYFGGSSDPALDVAAEHADCYLTWGEPVEMVAEKIGRVRELAARHGRRPRFGLRIHTLSRDTAEEAWEHAQWWLDGLDAGTVARAQAALAESQSTGQQRMLGLRSSTEAPGSARALEIAPNLWSGVGLVRGGAGTALVGSHEEVADRLADYHAVGIDEVILSGYPHDEEATTFGAHVMPRLRRRGLLAEPARAVAG